MDYELKIKFKGPSSIIGRHSIQEQIISLMKQYIDMRSIEYSLERVE